MNQLDNKRSIALGERVINELRLEGYANNYILTSERSLRCLEDDTCIGYDMANVKLVDHFMGDPYKPDGLLFVIETKAGGKGIMVLHLKTIKRSKAKRAGKTSINLIDAFWEAL